MTKSELIDYLKNKIADEAIAYGNASNEINLTYHEARQGAFIHVVEFLEDITISEKKE